MKIHIYSYDSEGQYTTGTLCKGQKERTRYTYHLGTEGTLYLLNKTGRLNNLGTKKKEVGT